MKYLQPTATIDCLTQSGLLLSDGDPALVTEHAVYFTDVVTASCQQGLQFSAFST
jgi:hypothetical protein